MPSSEASRNGSRGNGSRRSRTTSRKSTRRPAKWSRSRPERRTEASRGEAAGRDEGRKEVTPKTEGKGKRDGTRTEGMGCTPLAEGISFRPPSTSRRIVGVGSMVPRDYVDEVISSLFEDAVDPKISVVGVGGAGGKMGSALYDREIEGVETVAVNTDPAGLSKAECDVKILLPHSDNEDRVVGARVSAEEQEGALRASLSSDIVFIVAGLGGAAGTGAAPVVARAARANGAVTVGIAILPFEAEGRTEVARQGLEAFREEADSVVVLDNNSLDRFADQVSFHEAMQVISYMVVTIVQGVVEHLSRSYLSTLTEEIENAAREIEEQNNHAVPVDVQPPETVQTSWDLGPGAFDDQGFIGLR